MKRNQAQARRTNSGAATSTQSTSSAPLGELQAQESQLAGLRKAIVARLATHRDFRGVTIGGPEIAALAKSRSVAPVHLIGAVHIAHAVPRDFHTARPYLDPVVITVRWVENARQNKSGKTANWCAARTAAILQNWTPGIAGVRPLWIAKKFMEPLVFKPDSSDLRGGDVSALTRIDLQPAADATEGRLMASFLFKEKWERAMNSDFPEATAGLKTLYELCQHHPDFQAEAAALRMIVDGESKLSALVRKMEAFQEEEFRRQTQPAAA